MINHLRIRNFKVWQDSGDIRLAPLTLIFGANSAGKTSIPQLLLMLRQTIESTDNQRVLLLGDHSTLVDLGTYEEIVHQHDLEQELMFEIGWRAAKSVGVKDPISGKRFESSDLQFSAEIRSGQHKQPYVERFTYTLTKDEQMLRAGMRCREQRSQHYDLEVENYEPMRQPGRPWPLPAPYHFHRFPQQALAVYQNTAFVSDLSLRLEELMRSVFHVGPLRDYPDRTYVWSGEQHQHVGQRGERAVQALLATGERSFNWKRKQRRRQLDNIVAERLADMGLLHDFEVRPIAQGRKEHEVLVRTHPKLPQVKLTDVGFGVSQVMPVIVECFCTPPGSIMMFEQPEIHLHPKVQADLADVFVDAVRARENGKRRNVQFIIESHSEHFLRRLQRRIAEGELAAEDAALYFVHTDKTARTRIEELDVDCFGNIRNWPANFFGDEMADLVARSEAQARRMHGTAGGRDD